MCRLTRARRRYGRRIMTLRIGFLGAGLIGRYHSAMLGAAGIAIERAGVYDVDRARAAAFASTEGGTEAATEDQVLDGCDAVYVCTWTSEHRRLVDAACARGLAIFCEKPLSVDLAGAEAMAMAVADAGVVNQVGLVLRRSPAIALLKAIAEDPASGRPMAVVFRDDQYIPLQGMYTSTWRGDVDKAGAGTLLEHSIHDIDLLEHVLGPIESVSATTTDFHGIPGIEDGAVVLARFASGAVGTLTSVWHDVLERPSLRRIELFTERSHTTVEGDWYGPVATLTTGTDPQTFEGDALLAEVRGRGLTVGNPDKAFLQAVASGGPASPSFADALRAHVVVDAVYRSAQTGETLAITPPG
jgi:predicted dehydrogenase